MYLQHFFKDLQSLNFQDFVDGNNCTKCNRTFPDKKAILCHVGVKHKYINFVLSANGLSKIPLGSSDLGPLNIPSGISIKKEQLRRVREERERIIRDKARVFDNVEKTNKDVRSKNDLVQKLRSGVSFSRREEIEDQVKRLETQLARSNLKLPDERRLVTEIDRLKRSKRTLQEFDKEKQVSL